MISKESVFADARHTAPILGFRRLGPMSSDLLYDVASGRSPSRKSVGSSAATHHEIDSRQKVGKERLSDGRRRPPAARNKRRDIAETAMWRRLRSGPVIIAIGAGSGLGSSCLLYHIVAKRAFNGRRMPKESIYANARWTAPILGFRRSV